MPWFARGIGLRRPKVDYVTSWLFQKQRHKLFWLLKFSSIFLIIPNLWYTKFENYIIVQIIIGHTTRSQEFIGILSLYTGTTIK